MTDPTLCRVCGREMAEDSLRTVCVPCSAKAKQDAAQRRHRTQQVIATMDPKLGGGRR